MINGFCRNTKFGGRGSIVALEDVGVAKILVKLSIVVPFLIRVKDDLASS